MKNIITIILLFLTLGLFAQNVSKAEFEKEMKLLNGKIESFQSENRILKGKFKTLDSELSDLKDSLKTQNESNSRTRTELNHRIQTTGELSEKKISAVSDSLSTKSLYGIIGVLVAVLLSSLLYWLLSKQQKVDKSDFEGRIQITQKSLLEESAKLDTKLIEILDAQLKLAQKEIITDGNKGKETEIDHSLPLKVADEITRINAYANTLDPNSQDAKGLKSSVKRLINTFKVAQYEIIDLLGQKYDDRIPMLVLDRIENNNLNSGEEIISRIIKPLVKHKGEQIQAAQVETSFN